MRAGDSDAPPTKHARSEVDAVEALDSPPAPSLSLNPIFACSGPRSGLVSFASGQRMLDELLDTVDDSVYLALQDAWEALAVPASDYWRSGPERVASRGSEASRAGMADVRVVKAPNPRQLADSFYGTRLAALRGHNYRTNSGLVVVAVDRRVGNSSKLFSVLPRSMTGAVVVPAAGDSGEEAGVGAERHAVGEGAPGSGAETGSSRVGAGTVADFIASIPQLCDRSLYVLVDEEAAIDPYFDIDCSFVSPSSSEPRDSVASATAAFASVFPWWSGATGAGGDEALLPPVSAARVEELVYTIVSFLKGYVEWRLHASLEECLITTSSMQVAEPSPAGGQSLVELKLSFHVHFRLRERAVIASVREMHLFMSQLREYLDAAIADGGSERSCARLFGHPPPERAVDIATVVRRCVDFGVYSRWRAFRLPYNVKTPFSTGLGSAAAFTPVDAAVDDLLMSQLAQCGVAMEVPDVTVGAAASSVLQELVLSADPTARAAQTRLLRKMSFAFRFLLPLVEGVTQLSHAPLRQLLEDHAPRLPPPSPATPTDRDRFAAAVLDLATIQRDGGAGDALRLLRGPDSSAAGPAPTAEGPSSGEARGAAEASLNPFAAKKPPRPHCARVPVTDRTTMDLLAEVFACLAPQYAGVTQPAGGREGGERPGSVSELTLPSVAASQIITGGRITAQYEDSIRAYYVFQKQNRYCIRQARTHKATFAQLYLTFSSIKVRCYSNDCCDRCLFIPWGTPHRPVEGAHFSPGYPRYDRLLQLRDVLFPPLPLDELVRRYGPQVLDEVCAREQAEQQKGAGQPQAQAAGV